MKDYSTVESLYTENQIFSLFYQGYTINHLTALVASRYKLLKRAAQQHVEIAIYNYQMKQKKNTI